MLMSNTDRPARLHYLANGYRILVPGGYVLCAVSGKRLTIDPHGELRYWSVAKQEAYATAEIALKAMHG